MTGTNSSGRTKAAAGLTFGLGAAGLGVLSANEPLAGVAVYLLAVAVSLALWSRASGSTSTDTGRRSAADLTLTGVGTASAVVFPGLVAADGLGVFSWGPTTAGVACAVAALYAVYGLVSVGRLGVQRA